MKARRALALHFILQAFLGSFLSSVHSKSSQAAP